MNTPIQNPWVGPSSYQDPAKSDVKVRFCGRENETYDLTHLIDENFLVTLYGKSGNGKTSLLQAGVFQCLRGRLYMPVMIRLGMIDEGESFQSFIIENVERGVAEMGGSTELVPVIDEQRDTAAPDYLWNYFARHRFYNREGETIFPVVVFDQFEEVLRNRHSIERTQTLLAQLSYIIDESHALGDCIVNGEEYSYDFNFRFVISIREDELYRLEDCIDNIYQPSLKRCRYRLNALSRNDAREIILVPGGQYINPSQQGDVVARVIDSATNKDDGNISPFMLSLICSELFKKASAASPEAPQITVEMIEELGQNILRDFYIGVVAGIPEDQRIFLEENLVDANRMRNSVNVGMMDKGCPSWRQLKEGTNRILQETNGKTELVHDQLAAAVFEARESRKERERMAQLEREKEEMRRKNRRKMFLMLGMALLAAGVCLAFFTLYKKAEVERNNAIAAKEETEQERRNALLARDEAEAARAESEAARAESENKTHLLEDALGLNELQREQLIKSNRLAMANEGEAVTSVAKYKLMEGKGSEYIPKLLAVLPDVTGNSDRPLPEDAEYVMRSLDSQPKVFDGPPSSRIESVTYSPDGKLFAAAVGSDDAKTGAIMVVEVENGKKYPGFEGHTNSVNCVRFSPDGKYLASGSNDGTVRLWDVKTGKSLKVFDGDGMGIKSLSFSPDGKKIIASEYHDIFKWDVESGKLDWKQRHSEEEVRSVAYSPDGKNIVTASTDSLVRVIDARDGKVLNSLKGHTGWVFDAVYSPSGAYIASASWDKTVRIWDAKTGEVLSIINESSSVNSVSFDKQYDYFFVTASWDGSVKVRNTETGRVIATKLKGHNNRARDAEFSPDGKYIISSSWDSSVRIWPVRNPNCLLCKQNTTADDVSYASYSSDGKYIISAVGNELFVNDAETGVRIMHSDKFHELKITSVNYSPDGRYIMTASVDEKVKIYDVIKDRFLRTLDTDEWRINHATFSPDSKYIAFVTGHGIVHVNDIETGKELFGIKTNNINNGAFWVSFSPDGKRIVVAERTYLHVYDAKTGEELLKPMAGHTNFNIYCAEFSPDGKIIASAGRDRTIRLWDAKAGKQMGGPLTGHTDDVNTVSFSPDGKYIVSSSNDGTVRVWSVKTGKLVIEPWQHSHPVMSAFFSPDGKRIVSSSLDGTVRTWDFPSLPDLVKKMRTRFKTR